LTKVFDAYAAYYDLLYADKDYSAEASYVVSHIRERRAEVCRILELGCGTGSHAVHFAALGYSVHGVDQSGEMLKRAELRKNSLPMDVAARCSFVPGDVRTYRSGESYDVVLSLFHVMSYQVTNKDVIDTLETAYAHLAPGGTLLFDFWHGPAVLTQKPEVRIKRLENESFEVTRIAEPMLRVRESVVDVTYNLFVNEKESGNIGHFTEIHRLRYLFMTELEQFLAKRFVSIAACEWMTNKPLGSDSWSGFICAIRA
jgi:SAM-dependent methyltransferase